MNIKQHYQNFFAINDMGIGEGDQLYIEWATALLEDYKAEKAKAEPTHEQFLFFQQNKTKEVVEFYSRLEVDELHIRQQMIARVFRVGFNSALDFLVENRKINDSVFAEKVAISPKEVQEMIDKAMESLRKPQPMRPFNEMNTQEMIDEALEKHKPKK